MMGALKNHRDERVSVSVEEVSSTRSFPSCD